MIRSFIFITFFYIRDKNIRQGLDREAIRDARGGSVTQRFRGSYSVKFGKLFEMGCAVECVAFVPCSEDSMAVTVSM